MCGTYADLGEFSLIVVKEIARITWQHGAITAIISPI